MDASPRARPDLRPIPRTRRHIVAKTASLAGLIWLGAHNALESEESAAGRRRRRSPDHVTAERKRKKRCKRKAKVCAGQCGPVKNRKTCGKVLDCGACPCEPNTWSNLTAFGPTPSGIDALVRPKGVAIAADELTAWVADPTLNGVAVWTRPNSTSLAWSSQITFGDTGFFDSPQDVAVSRDGLTAWVSDLTHTVSVWTRPHGSSAAWTNQTAFGAPGNGTGQFTNPAGLAVATDTLAVWVADSGNARICVWTRSTATSTDWTNPISFGTSGGASNLANPTGVAVTANGLVAFVADSGNHRVSIWTRTGPNSTDWTNLTTFGSFGSGPGQLNAPFAVAISSDALSAWVTDAGNSRVSVWTRPSASSTAWTNQTTFGSEGIAANEFAQPRGLEAAADGRTVWVADLGNRRVSVWGRVCPA